MITETATVLEVHADHALVRCHRQADCQRCAEGRGCGGGVMSRLLGERLHAVRAATDGLDLRPGDEVRIGLEEQGLVQASAAVYLLPLLAALAAAAAASRWVGEGDAVAVLGAAAGFATGLAWARRFGRRRRADGRFRPRVLGAASGSPGAR